MAPSPSHRYSRLMLAGVLAAVFAVGAGNLGAPPVTDERLDRNPETTVVVGRTIERAGTEPAPGNEAPGTVAPMKRDTAPAQRVAADKPV